MAKPVRDRVTEYRKRRASEGGYHLGVWLDAKTVQMLASLRNHHKVNLGGRWSKTRLVAKAIKVLYDTTFTKPPVS